MQYVTVSFCFLFMRGVDRRGPSLGNESPKQNNKNRLSKTISLRGGQRKSWPTPLRNPQQNKPKTDTRQRNQIQTIPKQTKTHQNKPKLDSLPGEGAEGRCVVRASDGHIPWVHCNLMAGTPERRCPPVDHCRIEEAPCSTCVRHNR